MVATTIPQLEAQAEDTPAPVRKPKRNMKRLFSTESTVSSLRVAPESYRSPNFEYSLGKEFIFKILQLLVAIISAGFYSNGLYAMPKTNITSLIFPDVVVGSFIIITSVIAMSYLLGQLMPEILIRIFNAIATILYFVSACVTGCGWYVFRGNTTLGNVQAHMLFIHALTSLLNSGLYAIDLCLSVKKALNTVENDS